MTPLKPNTPRSVGTTRQSGVALVIALAFVVLLTGLMVAFFSRAMAERQISNSSANLAKVNLFAEGAVDQIIGDLKQEIADGSVSGTAGVFRPRSPVSMLPALSNLSGINVPPNLLKISGPDPLYTNTTSYFSGTTDYVQSGTARGTSLASTGTSLNGRSISLARWNASLLLPKANGTNDADLTPMTSGSSVFVAPKWVLVSRDGSNPTTWSNQLVSSSTTASSVVGRYAYAIYHEGGLLDINVAGYPTSTGTVQSSSKPALSYADLRQIPGIGAADPFNASLGALTATQQTNLINNIVGWRNHASADVSGSMGSLAKPGYTIASGSPFFTSIISSTTGFLNTSGSLNPDGQTDRMFASRQELIKFVVNGLGSGGTTIDRARLQNALQYLTHFSRDLDQPSYVRLQSTNSVKNFDYDGTVPKVLPVANGGNSAVGYDDKVNPSFLGVRITSSAASTRNDDSPFIVGEPLVKKRFALNRLAWLTYKGPSQPRATSSDADIVALKNAGITQAVLEQGTVENIKRYFGLEWSGSNWKYNQHNGSSGTGPIMQLEKIPALAAPHEPDFFELLKATINAGALGKALVSGSTAMPADPGAIAQEQPCNYNYYAENSVDIQILQIGANIISQFQTSNYPPRIVFDDGSGSAQMPRTIVGVANLPYLSSVVTGIVQVQAPDKLPRNGKPNYSGGLGSGNSQDSGYQPADVINTPGIGAVMQFPVLWNPHDPLSSTGTIGPTQFRIVADSATPDQAEAGSGQYRLMTYAGALDVTGSSAYSYAAASSSPSYSWYGDSAGTGNSIARPLKADDSAIEFTRQSGTNPLFLEPAMLVTPTTITDSGGNQVAVAYGAAAVVKTTAPVSSFFTNGGLTSFKDDGQGLGKYGTPYVGIYLGAFPLAWAYSTGTTTRFLSAARTGAFVARYTGAAGPPAGSYQSVYLTYRVQFKDPSGNWVTYDTKYGKTFNDCTAFKINMESGICGAGSVNGSFSSQAGSGGFWAFSADPRTSRFGLLWEGTYPVSGDYRGMNCPFTGYTGYLTYKPLPCYSSNSGGTFLNQPGGWVDKSNWISLTIRPDRVGGWYAMAGWPFSGGAGYGGGSGWTGSKIPGNDGTASGWMAFIGSNYKSGSGGTGGIYPGLQPGMLAQNNADAQSFYRRYAPDGGGGNGEINPPQYFADPDGIVRRGMGAFVPVDPGGWPARTSVGLPMAQAVPYVAASAPQATGTDSTLAFYNSSSSVLQATSQAQSRPYMLHRPFRTVGELGYVFSDTPWRNLDFSTAESGNSALLDVFCLNETSDAKALVAGKVNLNTRQAPVLQAVLAGGYFDPVQVVSGTGGLRVIDSPIPGLSSNLAKALIARTAGTSNGLGPLQNVGDLVGRLVSKTQCYNNPNWTAIGGTLRALDSSQGFYDGKRSYSGFSDGGGWDSTNGTPLFSSSATDVYSAYKLSGSTGAFSSSSNYNGTLDTITNIQRFREAPIRALAAAGQTRTWNLIIDVVAQTGRYPRSATALNNFLVEGEQRYWVHVAIDRYTGEVIDKQVEVVKE